MKMNSVKYRILKTPEFERWFLLQTTKERLQILGRLSLIENDCYFVRNMSYLPQMKILLLLGGNKNGQDKDIQEAKKILRKHYS